MKRRTEHLVEKRDGRREFLRATKLARSVHLALYEIGVDEDWRALEVASVVLEGLRQKRKAAQVTLGIGAASGVGGPVVLTTTEIADSVQHLLVVTGQPTAAVAYGAVQAERARRRQVVGVRAAGGRGKGTDLSRTSVGPIPKASIPKASIPKAVIPKAVIPMAGPRTAKPDIAKSDIAKSDAAGKPNVKPANRIWGEG